MLEKASREFAIDLLRDEIWTRGKRGMEEDVVEDATALSDDGIDETDDDRYVM